MGEVTVTISVTYAFAGKFLQDYLEQLDDYEDTPAQREWFAIDQLIGEEALAKLDPKHTLTIVFPNLPNTNTQKD